ncbi:hypothetical protein HPB50_024021 [Hyalomma asiaticum]|uniref:Uncharacterized protein n=1 Tax=Hyalomma asiaticum TaxID=266040 RepID=A0ACB7T1H7_HYAAI|nr:hypothetical protein HPB50_024021 [Hyalomma asiaticum]
MRVPKRFPNKAEGGDSLAAQDFPSDVEANASGVSTYEAHTFPVELREFIILQPTQSANVTKGVILTLFGKCASQQGLQFDFEGSDGWVHVSTSARRPSNVIRIYTWKSSLRRFQAFREVFSESELEPHC